MESLDHDDIQNDSPGREEADSFNPFAEAKLLVKSETTVVSSERTRRGSTCKQIRPLPTFVKADSQNCENGADKMYIRKVFEWSITNNKIY
jgi:hypothetical protein